MSRFVIFLCVLIFAATGAVASASTAPLTGAWVLDDGPGSGTSRYLFGAPGGSDGVRQFTIFDTYATFCEDGTHTPGSGSSMTGKGTATTTGPNVSIVVTSLKCHNGKDLAAFLPLTLGATLTSAGLDFGGGFVAVRPAAFHATI
jgi:hypothetical protein